MREMKEKEARRKRDDEMRIRKKAETEQIEEQKLAKVKSEMANKPFTHDSDGNIIWVQPPAVERLPNPTPSMSFRLKGPKEPPAGAAALNATAGSGDMRTKGSPAKGTRSQALK